MRLALQTRRKKFKAHVFRDPLNFRLPAHGDSIVLVVHSDTQMLTGTREGGCGCVVNAAGHHWHSNGTGHSVTELGVQRDITVSVSNRLGLLALIRQRGSLRTLPRHAAQVTSHTALRRAHICNGARVVRRIHYVRRYITGGIKPIGIGKSRYACADTASARHSHYLAP